LLARLSGGEKAEKLSLLDLKKKKNLSGKRLHTEIGGVEKRVLGARRQADGEARALVIARWGSRGGGRRQINERRPGSRGQQEGAIIPAVQGKRLVVMEGGEDLGGNYGSGSRGTGPVSEMKKGES